MKKIHFLLLIITIISCKNEIKTDSILSQKIENKNLGTKQEDTIIKNISKVCDELEEKNINEYFLCKRWDLLNKDQIKDILKNSKKGNNVEGDARTLHYAASQFPIWTTADVVIGKKIYKIKINGGSYFYLIDSENKTSLYFCKSENCRKYFITGIGTEDDAIYTNKIINIDKEIKSINTDLSSWIGFYEFDNGTYEQGYKSYHVKIEKNNCIFYQGDLPAYEVKCVTLLINNELFLYMKSDIPKDAKYDTSYLQNFQQGSYLLKIFKITNKLYLKTNLIKYWDEAQKDFTYNKNIELVKK